MKYTLLQMTQAILSSLDGDEVNSISDTTESLQVATIIKNSYYDIVSSLNLPEHKDLFELIPTNSSTPVVMTKPSDVTDIEWIKYNNFETDEGRDKYVDVFYMELQDFLTRSYALDSTQDNVESCTITTRSTDSFVLLYENNAFPRYYTTYDDNTVLFDGYMATEDSFLQKTKTQCYGQIIPTWTQSDSFTPDLDAKQFTLLLNEAKAQAFIELKQAPNPKAEKRARRGWIQAQRTKDNVQRHENYKAYGRK